MRRYDLEQTEHDFDHRLDLGMIFGIVTVSLLVRILFLLIKPYDAVSVDLEAWEDIADRLRRSENPYVTTTALNWPPFWMQVIFLLDRLSYAIDLPLRLLIQLFLIFLECGVIYFTGLLLLRLCDLGTAWKYLLFGYALNPIGPFLVVQHCNFDTVTVLFMLLATLFVLDWLQRKQIEYWLAGACCIGLAAYTKTFPLILAPLLAAGIGTLNWRRRMFGIVLLLMPITIGIGSLYPLAPIDIAKK